MREYMSVISSGLSEIIKKIQVTVKVKRRVFHECFVKAPGRRTPCPLDRQVTASLCPRFQISSRTGFSKTMQFECWNTPCVF